MYSQDRRHAVQVTDPSQGALGGSTYITLYSWRGLLRDTIFVGDYAITRPALVSWTGDHDLIVRYYEGGLHSADCKGSRVVRVHCQSIPFQAY